MGASTFAPAAAHTRHSACWHHPMAWTTRLKQLLPPSWADKLTWHFYYAGFAKRDGRQHCTLRSGRWRATLAYPGRRLPPIKWWRTHSMSVAREPLVTSTEHYPAGVEQLGAWRRMFRAVINLKKDMPPATATMLRLTPTCLACAQYAFYSGRFCTAG